MSNFFDSLQILKVLCSHLCLMLQLKCQGHCVKCYSWNVKVIVFNVTGEMSLKGKHQSFCLNFYVLKIKLFSVCLFVSTLVIRRESSRLCDYERSNVMVKFAKECLLARILCSTSTSKHFQICWNDTLCIISVVHIGYQGKRSRKIPKN